MKKLFSILALCALTLSAYSDDCEATYGVASVTFTRDGAQYKSGHFSVSATKAVKFSPANLAYDTSSGEFYFFENQYDYSHNTGDVRDLFAYGASGYDSKSPDGDAYATGDIEDTYYDWGVYNAITHTIGSSTTEYDAGEWRTLTWDEWYYLGYTRTNHATLIGGAKVNGIFGVILLPDDWVAPSNLPTFVASFAFTDVSDDVNTYTAEQWAIFENSGAVFLPAVCNSGCIVTEDATQAYCSYWSATQYDDTHGQRADFGNEDRYFREVDAEKQIRSSVRLVQDY